MIPTTMAAMSSLHAIRISSNASLQMHGGRWMLPWVRAQWKGTEALNLPVMPIGFPIRIEWFSEFGLMSEAIHS